MEISTTAPQAPTPTLRPTSLDERIPTIDVIRGVALLGILMMNIPGFALPEGFEFAQLLANPTFSNPNYALDFWILVLFEGKMRALFSMLFGAGVILFVRRKEAAGGGLRVADLYYRRMLWLIAFGVVDAFVLHWEGDILYSYGLVGLLLFTVRNVPPRRLLLGALLCFSFMAFKGIWRTQETKAKREAYLKVITLEKAHKKLTEAQKEEKEAWLTVEKSRKPDPKKMAAQVKAMQGNYLSVDNFLRPRVVEDQSTAIYQFLLWDTLGMMLLGMALFRWGVFGGRLSTRSYLTMTGLGYVVGIPVGLFANEMDLQMWQNIGAYFDNHRVNWNRATYDVRRVSMALGHVGLLMLLFRSRLVPGLMRALAAVGQMAFSNYVMHTLICTAIFFGYGLGYYGKLQYYQLFYVVTSIWVFQLIASPLWLRYFRFGPLEWVWRSLTYWKRQPMKRREEVAAVAV